MTRFQLKYRTSTIREGEYWLYIVNKRVLLIQNAMDSPSWMQEIVLYTVSRIEFPISKLSESRHFQENLELDCSVALAETKQKLNAA